MVQISQQTNSIVQALQQMMQQKRQAEQDELDRRQVDSRVAQMGRQKQVSGRIVTGGGKTWLVDPTTGEKRDLGIPAPRGKVGERNISDIINNMANMTRLAANFPEESIDNQLISSQIPPLRQELMKRTGHYEVTEPTGEVSLGVRPKATPEMLKAAREVTGSPVAEAIEGVDETRRPYGGRTEGPFAEGGAIGPIKPIMGIGGAIGPSSSQELRIARHRYPQLDLIWDQLNTTQKTQAVDMLKGGHLIDTVMRVISKDTPFRNEWYDEDVPTSLLGGFGYDQYGNGAEGVPAKTKVRGKATGQRLRPGAKIPGDVGFKPKRRHPSGKIPGDTGFKSRRGVTLPFDRPARKRVVSKEVKRPPKPKEYPNAVWNEEHQMWTIVKDGRLMGIK